MDIVERLRDLEPDLTQDGYSESAKAMLEAAREIERLREAVMLARDTFTVYADLHHSKGTEDADWKAARNADLALRMAAVLPPNSN